MSPWCPQKCLGFGPSCLPAAVQVRASVWHLLELTGLWSPIYSVSACPMDVTICVWTVASVAVMDCRHSPTDLELLELATYVLNVFVSAASIQHYIRIFIRDLQVMSTLTCSETIWHASSRVQIGPCQWFGMPCRQETQNICIPCLAFVMTLSSMMPPFSLVKTLKVPVRSSRLAMSPTIKVSRNGIASFPCKNQKV